MMMTSGTGVHYKGWLDCGGQILKNEGVTSFFKGNAANILRGKLNQILDGSKHRLAIQVSPVLEFCLALTQSKRFTSPGEQHSKTADFHTSTGTMTTISIALLYLLDYNSQIIENMSFSYNYLLFVQQ